jgi:polysaccharide export outer membrane protein
VRKAILVIFLLAITSVAFAQQGGQLLTRDQPYKIQPSDVIEVEYVYTPEYNQTATVEPDGTVRLKLIGSVKVAGLSLDQATTVITAKASVPLNAPQLILTLKDYVKPHFTVSGEVNKPGIYDMHGEVTLLQALALSGGLKDSGKANQVLLVRKMNNDVASVKVVNTKFLSSAKGAAEDFALRPDDMLIVPKTLLGKVEPYIRVASMGLTSLYGVALVK